MASKVKYPIRIKLLLLIGASVVLATSAYLALAIKLFKDDKTQLVYELNANSAKTLAAQVEATLTKYVDQVKLLTQGHREAEWVRSVFESEPDLVSYSLYKVGEDANHWERVAVIRNAEYLKVYQMKEEDLDRLREEAPIPFAQTIAQNAVAYSSTVPGGAPLITLALSIGIRGETAAHVAVVDIRSDKILKLVSNPGIATLFIVDRQGELVAHPDAALVKMRAAMMDIPIVKEAVSSNVQFQMKRYAWNEQKWLGAYALSGLGGLAVISQTPESRAFEAIEKLLEKSLLFALIVATAALLIASAMARSFTEPLRQLLEATERLARWDFGDTVHVKTQDEIANLARSFNSMASDIQRQRTELESGRTELELKVKERTAALEAEKKQASEAQHALLRTTRLASLGELAGAAAHEILNPLNNMNIRIEKKKNSHPAWSDDQKVAQEIIEGWKKAYDAGGIQALEAELTRKVDSGRTLLEEDLENLIGIMKDEAIRVQDSREDLEFMASEIHRISRMINGMRSLSRVGGERKPIDVHAPLEDTAATLGDVLVKRNVSLVKEYSAESRDRMIVLADKDELVQVFSNLVRNSLYAIDHADRRAGVIRMTTSLREGRIEVRIIDNGSGIESAHLPRIFEPTFTTKSVEDGTGLGLSISRRLVRAFGGDIEVERSIPGDGTTFLVWFPTADTLKQDGRKSDSPDR